MVPTLTCGFVRENVSFAMLSPSIFLSGGCRQKSLRRCPTQSLPPGNDPDGLKNHCCERTKNLIPELTAPQEPVRMLF
jgi:hypothetical protein